MRYTEIDNFIEEVMPELIEFRQETHANPELGLYEVKTTARAKSLLEKHGVYPKTVGKNECGCEIGLYYFLEGEVPGETVLLRADMDALPIIEKTDLPFSSKMEGVMHACGHDINCTFLLGAAIVAQKFRHLVRGNILFLWQPAEEIAAGAKFCIENGVLEGVSPKFGICFHVNPSQDVGQVATYEGPALAAADGLHITVKGKGGHAVFPHQTIDPMIISAHILTALQTFAARYHNPLDPLIVAVCKMQCGTAANVIAEEAEMWGTVRSFNKELQATLDEKITTLCKGIAQGLGGDCEVDYIPMCPAVIATPELFAYMYDAFIANLGEEHVNIIPQPMMGSEDFGFFCEFFPCTHVRIGSRFDDPRSGISSHSPNIVYSEDSIGWGVRAITSIIIG